MKFLVLTILLITGQTQLQAFYSPEEFIQKYQFQFTRPENCPLESKNFNEILAKAESVVTLFDNKCSDTAKNELTNIYSGLKKIEDDLNAKDIGSSNEEDRIVPTEVSGIKVSDLFKNIDTIIKKGRCGLEDKSLLEFSADLIQDFTQIGLLSSNERTIHISAGGFVLSSIFRLIDSFMQERFEFSKVKDRQSFIKLNCAFFDIRLDINKAGILEIASSEAQSDYNEGVQLLVNEEKSLNELNLKKNTLEEQYNKSLANPLNSLGSWPSVLKTEITKILAILPSSGQQIQNTYQLEVNKLQVINYFSSQNEKIISVIESYLAYKESSPQFKMMDELLKLELDQFSLLHPEKVNYFLAQKPEAFNLEHTAILRFHFERIQNELLEIESNQIKAINEEKKKVTGPLLAEITKKNDTNIKLKSALNRIKKSLDRVWFNSQDDGTESIVNILDDYNRMSQNIYGMWGDKFLTYTSDTANKQLEQFNKRFVSFQEDVKNTSPQDTDKVESRLICQNGKSLIINFKLADSLVKQGYDFININKDLIHSYKKDYFRRNQRALTEDNEDVEGSKLNLIESRVERFQAHYQSVLAAKKVINGKPVSEKDKEMYLENSIGTPFIGKMMIDIMSSKQNAAKVQSALELFRCDNIIGKY